MGYGLVPQEPQEPRLPCPAVPVTHQVTGIATSPRFTGGTAEDQRAEKVARDTSSQLGPVFTKSREDKRLLAVAQEVGLRTEPGEARG